MASKPEIIAELKRRGIPIPDQYKDMKEEGIGSRIVRGINEFGDRNLNPIGVGAVKTLGDIGTSVANIPLELLGRETIPHYNYEQLLKPNYNRGALFAGELASGLPAGLKAFGTAVKYAPKLAGIPGVLSKAFAGAGAGAAISEGQPGGRPLGAALGLLPTGPSLTNKSVGTNIAKGFTDETKKFNDLYTGIFKEASDKGVKKVPYSLTDKQFKELSRELPDKILDRLSKFKENPTLENAHYAQSDLLKYARQISEKTDLPHSVRAAGKLAAEQSKKLKEDIFKALLDKGGLDLPFKYIDIGERYKKEMVPYFFHKDIKNAAKNPSAKGAINPERLPASLEGKSGDAFRAALGHQYPELEVNRMLASPLAQYLGKGAAAGAGLGVGGSLLWELMKNQG